MLTPLGVVDGGNPFASNGKRIETDKSVAGIAADEWPSKGYTIVNAKDIDEAVALAKGNPMLAEDSDDVQARVYECRRCNRPDGIGTDLPTRRSVFISV